MNLKLAISDYTFPKLEWEQSLRLAHDVGAEAIDLGLFAGRSHLQPEALLVHPSKAAGRVAATVREHDLDIADVFGQPGSVFAEKAVNHPERSESAKAAEFFWRLLEFAARCNVRHLSLLPGIHFDHESAEDSLKRAAQELAWRAEAAAKIGITLGVEAHVGSIVPIPRLATRLIELTPGLTLTLDYTHFTYAGVPDDEIEPLLKFTSHFHARGACKGKLQASSSENTIDYPRVLQAMKREGYDRYIALEYVWTEWMRCNEVDNLTETILLRDVLRSINLDS